MGDLGVVDRRHPGGDSGRQVDRPAGVDAGGDHPTQVGIIEVLHDDAEPRIVDDEFDHLDDIGMVDSAEGLVFPDESPNDGEI